MNMRQAAAGRPGSGGRANPDFQDLSMIQENCRGGCGFMCSATTYPYCHECHPKFTQNPHPPPAPLDLRDRPEFSIMAETCATPNCTFRCSQATQPYCHECYERQRPPITAPPTAPPSSLRPAQTPNLWPQSGATAMQGAAGMDFEETHVVSLRDRVIRPINQVPDLAPRPPPDQQMVPQTGPLMNGELLRPCRTQECPNLAVKGNNQYCNNCYDLNLFGNIQGMPMMVDEERREICHTPGCNHVALEKGLCSVCFLAGASLNQQPMNITPQPEEKILNSRPEQRPTTLGPVVRNFTGAETSMRSMPSEHDETGNNPGYVLHGAVELQQQKMTNIAQRQQLCGTPGCSNLRVAGSERGLCLQCLQNDSPVAPPQTHCTNLEESSPEESCSPALTASQNNALNPVVKGSEDKVRCSFQGCSRLIYPPRKLCEECQNDLEIAKSEKARKKSHQLATQASGKSHLLFV